MSATTFRKVWWSVPVTLVFLSCSSDPTGPSMPQGTFELARIDGSSVPLYLMSPGVPGVDGHRTLYQSSTIEIAGAAVEYHLAKQMEYPHNVWTDVHIVHETATIGSRIDGVLEITDASDETPSMASLRIPIAFWDADSLVALGEVGSMVYLKR
jgi:hypothetical protein